MHLYLLLTNLDLVNLEVWENMLIFNQFYYLNRWVQFGCWNSQHHAQTIHSTEKFISINLLQMFCVITWDQKKQPPSSEKNEAIFQFYISKLQGQGKPYNHTQSHKVNYFDFCFVLKCFHISKSRTKPEGLDFQYYQWK